MQDTVELHNKPMQVKLKIRKDDSGQYEDQNEVVSFKALGAGAGPAVGGGIPQRAAAPAANAAAAAPAAGGSTPPWAKKAA
jgi:hypothetical protein